MDYYEQYREIIDTHPSGAPASPALTEILHILFTPEEIRVAAHMNFLMKKADDIAAKAALPLEKVSELLKAMADKAVINSLEKNGQWFYALLPTVPGIFETSFIHGKKSPMQKKLAGLWHDYNEGGMIQSLAGEPTPQMRVIAVDKALPHEVLIHSYDEVSKLIKDATFISVGMCACRESEGKCERPREACLIFGSLGKALVDRKLAREITKEEAMAILDTAEKSGLVHQSNNSADKASIICNCCPCCCHFLRGLIKFNNPNSVAKSHFQAAIDREKCTDCGICYEERCHFGALIQGDDDLTIDAGKCLGCGLCVSACPTEALSLELRHDPPTVPKTMQEMAMAMLQEKGKFPRFMEIMQK
jgi:ferredoxin